MTSDQTNLQTTHPLIARRFFIAQTFLRAAVFTLEHEVIDQIGARNPLEKDTRGQPVAPNALAQAFARLPTSAHSQVVAACCVAVENAAYAWEHTLKLLHFVALGENIPLPVSGDWGLDELYYRLPLDVRRELDAAFGRCTSTDFHLNEAFGGESLSDRRSSGVGDTRLQKHLNFLSNQLRGIHALYAEASPEEAFEAVIGLPLLSVEAVDRAVAEVLVPRLPAVSSYRMLTDRQPAGNPLLTWDGTTLAVSLPGFGATASVDAKWQPTNQAVLRIRKLGSDEWSPGFITPLNACQFRGLEPGVHYEVQRTTLTPSGEEDPVIQTVTGPKPQSS